MKKDALVREISSDGHDRILPCWVVEINENDIYPVKYCYKGKNYSDLIFSTSKHNIEYVKTTNKKKV